MKATALSRCTVVPLAIGVGKEESGSLESSMRVQSFCPSSERKARSSAPTGPRVLKARGMEKCVENSSVYLSIFIDAPIIIIVEASRTAYSIPF